MKLSEAIMLSIGVVRNNRLLYLSPTYYGRPDVCGCAIGAALYSMGYRQTREVVGTSNGIQACEHIWPWTQTKLDSGVTIAETISQRHFNGESRESIAKWIATIEPGEDVDNDLLRLPQADSTKRIITPHA